MEFTQPWILLILPLPLLWRFLMSPASVQQSALRVPFLSRLQILSYQKQENYRLNAQLIFLSLIWLLFVFAAANPVLIGKPIPLPQTGRAIMMAVDISGSMDTPDMVKNNQRINRLMVVKNAADQFIRMRKGDQLGLILFGSRAYLMTPLTLDRKTVANQLDDATVGLAGERTAIGDAIGLAIKRLKNVPKGQRILILMTDGANNAGRVSPIDAAKLAAEIGVRIYTIGLGAEEMLVNTLFGAQRYHPSADLDEKSLIEMARLTGGRYFRAQDLKQLQQIYAELDKLEPVQTKPEYLRPKTPLYPWLVGVALGLVVLMLWQMFGRSVFGLNLSASKETN